MISSTLGRSPWSAFESMSQTRLVRGGLRRVGCSPLTASESSTDCLTIVGCDHDSEVFRLVHYGAVDSVTVDRNVVLAVQETERLLW